MTEDNFLAAPLSGEPTSDPHNTDAQVLPPLHELKKIQHELLTKRTDLVRGRPELHLNAADKNALAQLDDAIRGYGNLIHDLLQAKSNS